MAKKENVSANGEWKVIIEPLSGAIGAQVRGVDLGSAMNDAVFAIIYQAWLDHQVLLFRDQNITDPQMIAFSRRFGDLDLAPIPGHGRAFVEGIPEMFVISNVIKDGQKIGSLGDGECLWHTDMAYTEVPPKASCLYSLEVPNAQGDTGFLNMYAAYETLPGELKKSIKGQTIKHDNQYTLDGLDRDGGPSLVDAIAAGTFNVAALPGSSHPIARTHPETGRTALFIGRWAVEIEGIPKEEGEPLIEALTKHAVKSEFTYTHHWQAGDAILWDNRCSQHCALPFDDENYERHMQRTTLERDTPFYQVPGGGRLKSYVT